MSSSEEILRRVEAIKLKVRQIGLDSALVDLWQQHDIGFLPRWRGRLPQHLQGLVQDAVGIAENAIEIIIRDSRYVVRFAEDRFDPSMESDLFFGTLEVFHDERRVLALTLVGEVELDGGMQWRPHNIEAFIDGPWVQDFLELEKVIVAHKERIRENSKAKEEKKKVADLKEKFGL